MEQFLIIFPKGKANFVPQGYQCQSMCLLFPTEEVFIKVGKDNVNHGQKPLNLIAYFVNHFSTRGGMVLDLCSGTGTTSAACFLLGRKCVGFEIDEKQYTNAKSYTSS